MQMRPSAFLALWNAIDEPRRQPEYEAWHSFEHVPERIGLPGFLEALRYRQAGAAGAPPYYFTCYWLDDIAALGSEPYGEVFRSPTRWTARMRGHLTRFLRLPCVLGGAHGVSSGAHLVSLHLRDAPAPVLDAALAALVREGHALAAQWGTFTDTAAIPIANTAADAPQPGRDRVVLLHHLDAAPAAAAARRLLEALGPAVTCIGQPQPFQLLTTTRRENLAAPGATRQPPREDLRHRFEEGDLA
jgi:hypothetical protein